MFVKLFFTLKTQQIWENFAHNTSQVVAIPFFTPYYPLQRDNTHDKNKNKNEKLQGDFIFGGKGFNQDAADASLQLPNGFEISHSKRLSLTHLGQKEPP